MKKILFGFTNRFSRSANPQQAWLYPGLFKTFLLFVGLIVASCDRDLEFDTITVTDPALEVQVEGVATGTTYPKIQNATVELYNSGGEKLATATTNSGGRVTFTKEQLKAKGTFTVKANKDALSGQATTPYMLLNDGVTFLTVTIR
ncbi:MAG: hypothetical protein AB2L20_16940 [Mangrovibacterium sp.]